LVGVAAAEGHERFGDSLRLCRFVVGQECGDRVAQVVELSADEGGERSGDRGFGVDLGDQPGVAFLSRHGSDVLDKVSAIPLGTPHEDVAAALTHGVDGDRSLLDAPLVPVT
jgi:hypothetical protein